MFKNIFITISILFLSLTAFAVNKTVMVDKYSNELKVPSKKVFWEKNISVFRQNKRIYVDMTPSISLANQYYYPNIENGTNLKHNFWTDTEIKVINKDGDLIYFTTTINLGAPWIDSLHNTSQANAVLYDEKPTIYYWYATSYNNKGGCWGQKIKFNATSTNSIGSDLSAGNNTVTAIWIIPDYESTSSTNFKNTLAYTYYSNKGMVATTRGELIKFIFDDPDNTVLSWRQNLMSGETNHQGSVDKNTDTLATSKLWRPCVLEAYGPILQQAPININIYGK
jgi:hypothetical protein